MLLADGLKEGEGGWLLFELLEDAESLGDAWKQVEHLPILADEQTAVLAEALDAIARLHSKGLWQEDLHLDNLLRHGGKLYLIDGAGIRVETPGQPLSRQKVLENLGVFLPSFPNPSSRSPKNCWCTTCWATLNTRCPWKRCKSRSTRSTPGD